MPFEICSHTPLIAGTDERFTIADVPLSFIIEDKCPINPNPVTSVAALTPIFTMLLEAVEFKVAISFMVLFMSLGEHCPCLAAVVMIPVPMGLVMMSLSPGFAPDLVISSPGFTMPIMAMPYLGSLSSIV